MITIYHNPRCSKSRAGVQLLEHLEKPFQTVLYMEDRLSYEELEEIIKKLGIRPFELLRRNESVWKEVYKDKNLTDSEIINLMVNNPQLIERPIVVKGNKAVVGRPTENIALIL
ncbi:MAG: arsenate reductase (glutaredoxin) [Flavobacteriaceae bacterium]